MWCPYHKITNHRNAHCRTRPTNGLNGNAYFAQVRPPRVPGISSSWDFPARDDSDEKLCILFSERSSLQPSPLNLKWKRRRGPDHLAQPGQQRRRGGALAFGHLLRVLGRPFPLEDR
ncbi:unnamed protein product [Ascophyllum nodosum]